ncbi:MAG TPA: Ig-like domain-containing protein [Gemmatimonadaceae bacterium]|nr:Ig-like domain-containing protein [Gemmatimonadaceae bacterium]
MKNSVLFAFAFSATSLAIAGCAELTGPESPETPINVTATVLAGGTSVRIDWQPSPQSDGVISYNVLRNGTKVGETTGTTFTDTGLAEVATYEYSVSANCTSGELSEPSPVTAASTVTTLDLTPPRVINNQPPNNFNGVSPGATATATFSEPMDPATINTTTFTLRVTGTGAAIPGTVTYNATTRLAEFKPASPMPSSTNVTATVTTGAKDARGNGLTANFIWAFTIADVAAPTVIATTPTNGAAGVSPTAPNITVTFSEPMDPNTINSGSFTLRVTGGADVPGTVVYNPATRVATFTPNAPLTSGTSYTATVAATVRDVAGNSLGTAVQFSFTTGDIDAPRLVQTAPANLATGVATNAVVTARFSEPMDVNTINTTTFTLRVSGTNAPVAGSVGYNAATNTATFTPTAPLSPSTGYIAAVTTGARDVAGNALAPSVVPNPWTFTTTDNVPPTVTAVSPTNGATGVATNTAVNITFSEAMDANTINGATITLRNPSTSALVAGVVTTVGTTGARFTPSVALAAGTTYSLTVTTGVSDVAGNAMAAPFTSGFTTAPAIDNTAPTVTGVSPANGATGVATNTVVNITFSEAMDAGTITGATISLRNTATSAAVAGAVSLIGTNVARFTPNVALAAGTGYTVTATTGVRDVAGNAMASQFTSTFTTVAAPDNTAPTVISVSPASGANAPPNTKVYVTFSEPMDATTITGTTFTLRVTSPSAAVAGTVSYNAGMNMAIFTPTSPLAASTGYTVTVTTAVEDVAGNPLASQFTSTFTTTAGADATAPTVTAVTPANLSTGQTVNSHVQITFSEGMDPTTITGTTFTVRVTATSALVTGTVSYTPASNVATFTPTGGLTPNTNYTVTVTTGVRDLAQNAMAAQFTSTFTTAP